MSARKLSRLPRKQPRHQGSHQGSFQNRQGSHQSTKEASKVAKEASKVTKEASKVAKEAIKAPRRHQDHQGSNQGIKEASKIAKEATKAPMAIISNVCSRQKYWMSIIGTNSTHYLPLASFNWRLNLPPEIWKETIEEKEMVKIAPCVPCDELLLVQTIKEI